MNKIGKYSSIIHHARNDDGSINVEETVKEFSKALSSVLNTEENVFKQISDAANRIFDEANKSGDSARFGNTLYIVNCLPDLLLVHLGVNAKNILSWKKYIWQWEHENVGKNPDKHIFGTRKGRNGGFFRWSDTPNYVKIEARRKWEAWEARFKD